MSSFFGGRGLYYDRSGEPIDAFEAGRLLGAIDERRVAVTNVGDLQVSTVFIPMAQPPWDDDRPPLLFETMVFGDDAEDLICERYATEDQALDGHHRVVESLRVRTDGWESMRERAVDMLSDEPSSG